MSIEQPSFMIITWGCQMNEDDSKQMGNMLVQAGYRATQNESEADLIILNTCSVRAKPEQKVKSKLGELRFLKEKNPELIIAVCGCMAQIGEKFIRKSAPFVDIIMGTGDIAVLPSLVDRVKQEKLRVTYLNMPKCGEGNGVAHAQRLIGETKLKMFVPVMYGCNNFCAYCVVPYARGQERSRPASDIVEEIKGLVSAGCREVTLVGQNVNSYGQTLDPPCDFASLLVMINDIPGIDRIRFTTSHPKDLSEDLIEAIASLPKVCEHIHLPIQSGDNEVLRRMGRKYTIDRYKELISRLRESVPGISITTDIMVGFPGETDEQFRNTMSAVYDIQFDGAFMFAYSARPGTKAAAMEDQVDSRIKNLRLRELVSVQNEITYRKNLMSEGTIFEVLAEGASEKDPSQMIGYTRTNKVVAFPYIKNLEGTIVRIRAIKAHPWGFTGELVI